MLKAELNYDKREISCNTAMEPTNLTLVEEIAQEH